MIPLLLFQDSAKVAFAAPAMAASELVPRIGAALGLRLETDRRAGRQILLVRVKEMPRDRLLALVAETAGGIWHKTDQGLKLTIDSGELASLWKVEAKAREAWIARRLAEKPVTRANGGINLAAPAAPMAAQLVGAEALAALRPGERVVWSTNPTRLQRHLPSAALDVARKGIGWKAQEFDEIVRNSGQIVAPPAMREPVEALFAARRDQDRGTIRVAFGAYDATGKTAFHVLSELIEPVGKPLGALAERLPKTPQPFPKAAMVWAGDPLDGGPPAALSERMKRPDREEPLALGAGPALDALAQAAGTDLVACISDAAYARIIEPIGKGISTDWAKSLPKLGFESRLEGNTLILRPRDQAASVEDRADRTTLRLRIAAAEFDGRYNYRYAEPNGLEKSHLERLSPLTAYPELTDDRGPWPLAALWDGLSAAQREAAQGGGLSLRRAPGLLDRLITLASETMGSGLASRLQEPTVLFGSPAWNDALLTANVDTKPGATFQAAIQPLPLAGRLDAVASMIGSGLPLDRPGARAWPASVRTIRLTVAIPNPYLSCEFDTEQVFRDRSAAPTTSPELFPALRERVERMRAGG